ncbi:hypothetical protein [Falsirhodobacter sp. 20TX0035]|uniref:hypothetical protein n=1 Tax=Falsirhodobacter sp. 20TX0035 TaxID=3022019 RepID=UPI00232BE63E|nr:hypothetical protein [Falsirhodobacter sp. 20TX0035]MDB6454395.1 hypothetical protein [Falsirhodobacter sp. 20TX0035]
MSISLPASGTPTVGSDSQNAQFEANLNIAKSSQIISSYMNETGQGAITKDGLQALADNPGGDVSSEVSAAASYMIRHEDVFTAIETHDVAGADNLSGTWNFDWAAKGGLDGTAISAIASMEDAFDRAIGKSAQITELTTEAKTELDASKQRPQN